TGFDPEEIDTILALSPDAETKDSGEGDNGEDLYTKKIEAPIYDPKSDSPPPLTSLVDFSKSESLTKEIEAANVPDNVKAFLKAAAGRHTVFNYEAIAEFYSHAPAEVQDLMERSALV